MLQSRIASENKIDAFQNTLCSRIVDHFVRQSTQVGEALPICWNYCKKPERFKEWLKGRHHDKELVREYFKSVTADSWIDRLPCKSVRWFLFTGLGLAADAMGAGTAGTAAGVALSGSTSFASTDSLDGWKPSQFVDGPLRGFLEDEVRGGDGRVAFEQLEPR